MTPTQTQIAGDLVVARLSAVPWLGDLGLQDSDYMPGRTASAPTGDVGAAPEFWRARSGSASIALWMGPTAQSGSHGG